MNSELLANILAQGDAVRAVAAHFRGSGRNELAHAAELVRGARHVLVTGMGASLFASMTFPYFVGDRSASVVESAELIHFRAQTISRRTCLVVVSRSGESVEIVKLLELARERGATTVGISNVSASTLLRECTLGILLHSPVDQLVAVQTYTVTAIVMVLLAAAVAGELEQALSELDELASQLPAWIPECEGASTRWNDFTASGLPLYFLGRGPAMASVSEGVLLMHETAKTSGVGMSIAQFRHGPVEAVDANFRAIVIGTQQETVALDVQFARDLASIGAKVGWIGAAAADSSLAPLVRWPKAVPGRFSSVPEAIVLQFLAYRTAEVRGIKAVPFRWAPAVTASETGFLAGNRA